MSPGRNSQATWKLYMHTHVHVRTHTHTHIEASLAKSVISVDDRTKHY